MTGMAERYEYLTVKVPMNSPRKMAKILNRHARAGWELVETQRGPLLSRWDHATLRRALAADPEPPQDRATPAHVHQWDEVSTDGGRRHYVCACGAERIVG